MLKEFVSAFINFPKPLIAAVNGPAIGIAVTTLAICDVVYASESATFTTPFTALGQSPEGLSSLLFPQIFGRSTANEMLLMGKTLTAKQAQSLHFVSEVFPDNGFHEKIHSIALKVAKLPANPLKESKKLIRSHWVKTWERVNEAESELLVKMWTSDDCMNAIMNFMQSPKSSKL